MSDIDQADDAPIVATLNVRMPAQDVLDSADDTVRSSDQEQLAQESFALREGTTFRVGRARTNDLTVVNPKVSRFHAVFSVSRSGVVLSDLSSLNGTLVNGSRISAPVDLSSGDSIGIGKAEMDIQLNMGDDSTSMTAIRTQTAQMSAVVVTVLVVDVCGYTKLSEVLPPKDVADMLHSWFQEVTDAVKEFGGEVDKYIGDCVMALWRGTSQGEADESAKQATKAAQRVFELTEKLNEEEWPHRARHVWRCRAALNTGDALIGTVGSGGARDFTVLGDTVNVAFRLEGVAGELGQDFLLSAQTASRIKDSIPVKLIGPVEIEGRNEDVEVFTLEG